MEKINSCLIHCGVSNRVRSKDGSNFQKLCYNSKENIIVIGSTMVDIGKEPKSLLKELGEKMSISNIGNTINNLFNSIKPVSQSSQVNMNQYKNNNTPDSESKEKQETKSFKEILGDSIFVSEEGRKSVESVHMKCNHDPNDESTTLEQLKKRTMQFPPQIFMACKECHKGFKFMKNEDGSLKEIENNT